MDNYRVYLAESGDGLKDRFNRIEYQTGCLKTAKHSAIADIKALGKGAVFVIYQLSATGTLRDIAYAGEYTDFGFMPRNGYGWNLS